MFRTTLPRPKQQLTIQHDDGVLLMGSCFADTIGEKLTYHGFRTLSNPFGTTYNPLSIAKLITQVINDSPIDTRLFTEHQEVHYHHDFHSQFAALDKAELDQKINATMENVRTFFETTNVVCITLGTSLAYQDIETGSIVNNCHKKPQKHFEKVEISINQGYEALVNMASLVREKYPHIRFVWTLSPVRHIKDGIIENNRSKARCMLMIDKICQLEGQEYFPSYELLMDDLRDYRYYADDLIHPNAQAIKYIWEQFSTYYFDDKTIALSDAIAKIRKGYAHRPFNPETASHKAFVVDLDQKAREMKQKLPHLRF